MNKLGFIAAALVACLGATTAEAQDFFKGKRLTVIAGSGVGGSYDLYARLLADNIGKFIPGNPNVVVENRVGAGSRLAMNYLYRQAPKDGTVIGLGTNLLPFDQFVFPDAARQYDITKFKYLGNMASLNGVIAVWHTTGVKTFEDIKKKEVILGANSRVSETYIIPAVLNQTAGTKFKIVHGFPGNVSEIDLAIERGEVFARGGSWASFRISHPDWVKEGKIIPIVQNGSKRAADLPDVPLLIELAQTEEQKSIFNLLMSGSVFSRAFAAPPEVPDATMAILRKGFMDTVTNKEFVAYAEGKGFEITPSTHEELERVIADVQQTIKPEFLDKIRPILQQE
ncbi:MAG TPA: tripartite tricarboxylate transporter substrate-binding protein [Alphaproteobacteria bacterium]|nr:tripartite tricarboxylate transporter substrate-binding protein [Alphaproteobacteria bacterium]